MQNFETPFQPETKLRQLGLVVKSFRNRTVWFGQGKWVTGKGAHEKKTLSLLPSFFPPILRVFLPAFLSSTSIFGWQLRLLKNRSESKRRDAT